MITNAADLPMHRQTLIAQQVSSLNHQPNSSLLSKSTEEIMAVIASGIMLVKTTQDQPLFIIAFEPTGNPLFTEVGMTCNLAPEQIRGKHIFPNIIETYRKINGNGKQILYLTTTDIRMMRVAEKSGFQATTNIHTVFPPDVLEFCCAPCSQEKTGAPEHGQQKICCPRFKGEFLPQNGDSCTQQPCRIFTQVM